MLDQKQLFRCMCAMSGMFPRLYMRKKVDAIFIWGRAADEWQTRQYGDGLLALAADLHRHTDAPVVIPGYEGSKRGQETSGYPGPDLWRNALSLFGVKEGMVLETSGNGINTKTEMDDFLDEHVRRRGWKTIAGFMHQHQALRAMLGTVKSLETRNMTDIIVAPMWPVTFDWSRSCFGWQGAGPYPRLHWIDEEFDRIPRYQAQGDLATFDELYAYLSGVHQDCAKVTD